MRHIDLLPEEKALEMHDERVRQYGNVTLLTLLHRAMLLIGLVAAALLIWNIAHILLVGFAGVLLAVFLRSLSDNLHHYTGLPKKPALGVVILALLVLIGLSGWLLIPRVVDQLNALLDTLPQTLQQIQQRIASTSVGQRIMQWLPENSAMLPDGSTIAQRLGGIFSTTVGILGSVLIFLFLGIYLALEPETYIKGFVKLVPPDRRPRAQHVLTALGTTLQRWLLAKIIAMLVIGVLTTIGLYLLGMPLALALGVIAGLLSFIPTLGPILAEIPALLIALNEGPWMALWVLLLYLGIQAVESYLLLPLILRQSIELPPVVVLLAITILGSLFGVLGAFVAAPLTASVMVLTQKLYIEDTLGDDETSSTRTDETQSDAAQEQRTSG